MLENENSERDKNAESESHVLTRKEHSKEYQRQKRKGERDAIKGTFEGLAAIAKDIQKMDFWQIFDSEEFYQLIRTVTMNYVYEYELPEGMSNTHDNLVTYGKRTKDPRTFKLNAIIAMQCLANLERMVDDSITKKSKLSNPYAKRKLDEHLPELYQTISWIFRDLHINEKDVTKSDLDYYIPKDWPNQIGI